MKAFIDYKRRRHPSAMTDLNTLWEYLFQADCASCWANGIFILTTQSIPDQSECLFRDCFGLSILRFNPRCGKCDPSQWRRAVGRPRADSEEQSRRLISFKIASLFAGLCLHNSQIVPTAARMHYSMLFLKNVLHVEHASLISIVWLNLSYYDSVQRAIFPYSMVFISSL